MINVRDNEDNTWKRNAKIKNKDRKEQEKAEATVKEWKLNNFVVHLS